EKLLRALDLLLEGGLGQPGEQGGDGRRVAGDAAGEMIARIALKPPRGRDVLVFLDAELLERLRRQHRPAVEELHVYRVVRSGAGELVLDGRALLGELLGSPAARDDQPGAGLRRFRGCAQA